MRRSLERHVPCGVAMAHRSLFYWLPALAVAAASECIACIRIIRVLQQFCSWWQSDPGFYASYLTEETMWLTLAYFMISAATGTLALVASYSAKAYAPGVPPTYSERPLHAVPWISRFFWNNTLRAQQVLFGIT